MKILLTCFALSVSLAACDTTPVEIPPTVVDTNVLHESVGKCGHVAEPCCLHHDFPFDSFCTDGGACVGADLSCHEADGEDGVVGSECGVCGDPEKLYQYMCTEDPPAPGQHPSANQTAYLYVEHDCQLQVRCGYLSAESYDACVTFFDTIASGRCSAEITSSDSKIEECFAETDAFICNPDDVYARPASCDMLFFSGEKHLSN